MSIASLDGPGHLQTAPERTLARLMHTVIGDHPPITCAFTFPSGYTMALGHGTPTLCVEVRTARGLAALQSLDELRLCEAYMDEDIDFVGDLQQAMLLRQHLNDQRWWMTLWRRLQPLLMGRYKAQEQWVQNHYDANHIQLHFIDRVYNTYTPGVFEDEDEPLECASERKHRLAFEGVRLQPGDRVLDIGFGWGSFLRYAARRGVHVTGLTLSRQQLQYVQDLVNRERLPATLHHSNFFTYEPQERFDAISMLGVIEELADYPATMQRIARWVKPGGRVYLDFMAATQDFIFPAFISKYIYQGGTSRVYLPKFIAAVTQSPFELIAVHNDRRNYYLTTTRWYANFERQKDVIRAQHGERLYRMFRLYLAGNPLMLNHPSHLTTAFRVFLELPTDRHVS